MMQSFLCLALLLGMQDVGAGSPQAPEVQADQPQGEEPKVKQREKKRAKQQMTYMLAMLSALAMFLLFLGGSLLIIRIGKQVRKRRSLPVRYHSMRVEKVAGAPIELSAEERLGNDEQSDDEEPR